MFSALRHFPPAQYQLRVHRGPDNLGIDRDACHGDPQVAGMNRYKYFRRPIIPYQPSLGGQVVYARKPVVPEPVEILVDRPATPATRTLGIQTVYRESEAQTDPYSPEYTLKPGQMPPELLALATLSYGMGLPAGMVELEMIERARIKRAWEAMLPQVVDKETFEKRLKMMEEMELQEWQEREEEIRRLQEARLEILTKVISKREKENEQINNERVERIWQRKLQEREAMLEKIESKRVKALRKLTEKRNKVGTKLERRDIIADYANYSSKVYAPKARDGIFLENNQSTLNLNIKGIHDYTGLVNLETAFQSKLMDRNITLPKAKGLKLNPTARKEMHLQEQLKLMEIKLKERKQTIKAEEKPLRFQVRNEKPPIRPPTPKIKEPLPQDEEFDVAAILLQKIIRGRISQNLMYQGKERRLQLINELRTRHTLKRALEARGIKAAIATVSLTAATRIIPAMAGTDENADILENIAERTKTQDDVKDETSQKYINSHEKSRSFGNRNEQVVMEDEREDLVTKFIEGEEWKITLDDIESPEWLEKLFESSIQAEYVGKTLDFLSKELVRLREERRIFAMVRLAERTRLMREANETQTRDVELTRRKEEDEVFRRVMRINQETVDSYLADIVSGGIENAARVQATEHVHEYAEKIATVVQQMEEKEKCRAKEFGEEENSRQIVADLILSFLVPEVEREHIQDQIKQDQRKYLLAAHRTVYSEVIAVEDRIVLESNSPSNEDDRDKNNSNQGTGSKDEPQFQNAKQRRAVPFYTLLTDAENQVRVIKVQEFVEARQFEIQAMESALKNASEFTGNMRVFQTLPRHMRRRAASYNVKRLPQRFRQRAIDQMSKDKLQAMKKSRRAKRRPGAIFEMFQKRSRDDQRWLDTHLWHAKRMHMVQKWGFMLANHPNDKGTRASYRATQHTATVHDASYTHCIQLTGPCHIISTAIASICDPTYPSVKGKRYISGARRRGVGFLHQAGAFPDGSVAPFEFFWVHVGGCGGLKTTTDVMMDGSVANSNDEYDDYDNGSVGGNGVLWIWVHPAAGTEALELIESAVKNFSATATLSLESLDSQLVSDVTSVVQVICLKSQLARFELTGPRAHAILHEVLRPDYDSPMNKAAHETWKTLEHLLTPASLPPGIIIGLSVLDPRLSFPPKMKPRTAKLPPQHIQDSLHKIMVTWPEGVANTDLHNPAVRAQFLRMNPTDKTINDLRVALPLLPPVGMLSTPATVTLPKSKGGPCVPVLLVQRNPALSNGAAKSSAGGNISEFVNGWDLILPAGMAAIKLWQSLVYAGAHAIGLQDRRRLCFENAVASMPEDYPETRAHAEWAEEERRRKTAEWERRPVDKRMNYDKIGVGDPFFSNFWRLVGSGNSGGGVRVLHGSRLIGALRDAIGTVASFDRLAETCKAVFVKNTKKLSGGHVMIEESFERFEETFVRCRFTLMGRGSPEEHGIVYRGTAEEISYWNAHIDSSNKIQRKSKQAKRNEEDDEFDWTRPPPAAAEDKFKEVLDKYPEQNQIIGYLSNGGFSMMQGQGTALGCCLVKGLHQVIVEARECGNEETAFVLVRGPKGRVCWPARFHFIE
ncbi:Cilia- and flagella-associated protein 91 [Physocladia obscura]|uniref:Cilia- and flagella-associated protein 91 n=1 Tax=Physocladia obscura TaxID=109957 RepID=A0AAD5T5G1_9FUNG|nr:Cilia- and flagella-associated protein 91 [Physocladia obscura]